MNSTPSIIDVHAHIVFEGLHGSAGVYGPEIKHDEQGVSCFRVGEYIFKSVSYEDTLFTNIGLRLEEMDRLGINIQVLSPNPLTMMHGIEAEVARDFCRRHNNSMSLQLTAYRDRFLGLAALPMQDIKAACLELNRAVSELGLSGAFVGTDFSGGFAAAEMDQLYRTLVDLDVPLFIHPSSTNGVGGLADKRLEPHNLSLSLGYAYEEALAVSTIILGGVYDRHPDLDICISHGGGCAIFLADKFQFMAEFDPNVPSGVSENGFLNQMRLLWFDSHLHGDQQRNFLADRVGTERLVFGTNMGGFDTPVTIQEYATSLTENAEKLMRLT